MGQGSFAPWHDSPYHGTIGQHGIQLASEQHSGPRRLFTTPHDRVSAVEADDRHEWEQHVQVLLRKATKADGFGLRSRELRTLSVDLALGAVVQSGAAARLILDALGGRRDRHEVGPASAAKLTTRAARAECGRTEFVM